MDKTALRLLGSLIAITGLFLFLNKFSSPKLSSSFFGANPYAMKRDCVDYVMNWISGIFLTLGIIINLATFTFLDSLPNSSVGMDYIKFILVCSLVMLAAFFGFRVGGRKIARRRWLPMIIEFQRPAFDKAKDIISHEGWRSDQLVVKDKVEDPRKYIEANYAAANEYIDQIEDLLELPKMTADLKGRVDRLEKYF